VKSIPPSRDQVCHDRREREKGLHSRGVYFDSLDRGRGGKTLPLKEHVATLLGAMKGGKGGPPTSYHTCSRKGKEKEVKLLTIKRGKREACRVASVV